MTVLVKGINENNEDFSEVNFKITNIVEDDINIYMWQHTRNRAYRKECITEIKIRC